jgi:hypothetical protein
MPVHQGQSAFFKKSQRVHILGCVGHMISVAATQLYHCGAKATVCNVQVNGSGCVPIKLYL